MAEVDASAAMIDAGDNASEESLSPSPSPSPSPSLSLYSWRIRDVAVDLPAQRQVVGGSSMSATTSITTTATSHPTLTLSSHFDVDTCLARIRRDKAPVVRNAFDAAAACILDTLLKADDGFDTLESIDDDDLPTKLDDIPTLERIRFKSMVRSHDNKDPSKRKSSDERGSGERTGSGRTGGGASASGGRGNKTSKNKTNDGTPKFTRNTPASSAAALDSRLTSSRAILCTAANVAFDLLTPPLPGVEVDVADVPQNPNKTTADGSSKSSGPGTSGTVSNMGAVVVEATTLGKRIASVATNATRRSARRYQYRKDNVRYDRSPTSVLQVKNPFAWKDDDEKQAAISGGPDANDEHVYDPNTDATTEAWTDTCLPRLVSILHTGVGHALYHDTQWKSRHGRIANLLQELAVQDANNFGPHLILTVEPDVDRFAREFRGVNSHLRLISDEETDSLRALKYGGSPDRRRRLRKQFPDATGLAEAPFHVIICSYAHFLQDYLHFCQLPFESVVVDDGASLLAAAQVDLNSQLGTMWDAAFFSKSDHQMGLAGATPKEWDFGVDKLDEDMIKDAWIGLTTRHRILTTSAVNSSQARSSADLLPVSGLVNFVAPHFADSVREEWDRSRISNDSVSMKHFRKLLTRSVVVHAPQSEEQDVFKLALQSLTGKLSAPDRSEDPVPDLISDEDFVNDGKIGSSRRSALQWLGRGEDSWLRYEVGIVSFQPILDAMRASGVHGHLCEEIVTASSTTTTGATGQVAGTLAYRLAVRCGRHFGSEQGLRQHLSALHAPPGTWLCRTCGSDCVTSQARTHHERSCGQPTAFQEGENGGAPKSTGVGSSKGSKKTGPVGVVGKKTGPKTTPSISEEKDPDGSIRVSGYRGVWVNQAGKHFVKIDGERLKDENGEILFPGVEEAAKKHDEVLKSKNPEGKAEYNFKDDGIRIAYEDLSTSSTTGLGGGAASVVPALSVINIKDLPPDVKPLLRDPRQTSRTGGNSKRHVYAYRGVCRQARKGHDRWQSQISFMGVNHYLGTFDSEWDAAAIYAWAHFILYGEEATKQAQKEGEEAAAAYEKEKRDIAAGILPPAPPKPEKKQKRKPGRKPGSKEDSSQSPENGEPKKRSAKEAAGTEKKRVKVVVDKESLAPILAKSTGRAAVLAPRHMFVDLTDVELAEGVSRRLIAARELSYAVTDVLAPAPVRSDFRPTAPVSSATSFLGGAMLLGLSPSLFNWLADTCLADRSFSSEDDTERAQTALTVQFGPKGENESFRTLVQGTTTVLGCASYRTQRVYTSFNFGTPPIGGAVGAIDCHIGGSPKACSESAASIRYNPTPSGDFQFSALSDDDVITMNGRRITPAMGSFPLFNEDVCTVGPRVFVFLLPTDA